VNGQGKLFRCLDARLGVKLEIAKASAYESVVRGLYKCGIFTGKIEFETLLNKARAKQSDRNYEKEKKKIKREIKAEFKSGNTEDI
jgi:cobyric acid synthase